MNAFIAHSGRCRKVPPLFSQFSGPAAVSSNGLQPKANSYQSAAGSSPGAGKAAGSIDILKSTDQNTFVPIAGGCAGTSSDVIFDTAPLGVGALPIAPPVGGAFNCRR